LDAVGDVKDRVVELRVHGVSGTPPTAMLGDPAPRQVAGDDSARVFRRTSLLRTLPKEDSSSESRVVEAFHWGRFTAGSGTRALWLLLAPFAVLNVARYALLFSPEKKHGGRRLQDRAADAVLRLLGVALTLSLVVNVAYVVWDVLVRQCAGPGRDSLCIRQNGWLGWLAGRPFGLQLLVGAVAPAVVLGLLWWFGRQVFLYDPPGTLVDWRESSGSFDDAAFWHTSPKAPMLRALHIAAAGGVVGMLCVGMLWSPARQPRPRETLDWVLLLTSASLLAIALVFIAVGPEVRMRKDPLGRDPVRVPPLAAVLRWLAVAVALMALVWTVVQRWSNEPELGRSLGGFEVVANLTAVAVVVLLLLLLVVCSKQRRGSAFLDASVPPAFRPFWRGYGAWMLASLACLLGNGFAAATTFQVAALVGRPVPQGGTQAQGRQAIEVTTSYWSTAIAWTALVALLVLLLLAAAASMVVRAALSLLPGRARGPIDAIVADDYPGTPLPRGLHRIVRRWHWGLLKYRYHWALGALAVIGGLSLVLVGILALLRVVLPDWRITDPATTLALSTLGSFGTVVISGLAGLLLLLGLRTWRSPSWRTSVGILWDLLSFWPRLAHPICPPPYGGRAVLGVADRTRQLLLEQQAGAVVLSGHSQGSLVSAAALSVLRRNATANAPQDQLMVEDEAKWVLQGTCLVTYGCQLQFLYSRLFPAYIGYHGLSTIYGDALACRWRNLYRWTDPLGGPVLIWPERGTPYPFRSSERLTSWHEMPRAGQQPGVPVTRPVRAGVGRDDPAGVPSRDDDAVAVQTGDDVRLRDPAGLRDSGWHPRSPLRAHGGYYEDPVFDQVVADLARTVTARSPATGERARCRHDPTGSAMDEGISDG
jgi:hypothetical protein